MKKSIFYLFLFSLVTGSLLFNACQKNKAPTWIISKPGQMWQVAEYTPSASTPDFTVRITGEAQEITAWGACFNEPGWTALQSTGQEQREQLLKEFYHPEEGLRFTVCRMPIEANDYATEWYSLNDSAGDMEMEHFSIERDWKNLIPYIKAAMEYNPELKIWGSPWCPPAWMKVNKHYACRPAEVNNLPESGAGQEGRTQFIMEQEYLEAYADYFSNL